MITRKIQFISIKKAAAVMFVVLGAALNGAVAYEDSQNLRMDNSVNNRQMPATRAGEATRTLVYKDGFLMEPWRQQAIDSVQQNLDEKPASSHDVAARAQDSK